MNKINCKRWFAKFRNNSLSLENKEKTGYTNKFNFNSLFGITIMLYHLKNWQ